MAFILVLGLAFTILMFSISIYVGKGNWMESINIVVFSILLMHFTKYAATGDSSYYKIFKRRRKEK